LLTVLLLHGGQRFAAAQTAPCDNTWLAGQLPQQGEIELLVAAGSSIPSPQTWTLYRSMAREVIACASPGTRIVLRPIDASPLTDETLFDHALPSANDQNTMRRNATLDLFEDRVQSALARLPEIGKSDRSSDPIAALQGAAQDPSTVRRVTVMIFNGWQQSHSANILVYGRNAADYVRPVVDRLRKSGGLPQLHGSSVYIFGLTAWPHQTGTPAEQINGLCRFWTAIVGASGGKLGACSADMPGLSPDDVR
jgi:hypothetical protein